MPPETCLIDGFGPVPVERPATVADVGAAVRRAAAEKEALYPLGGRTMLQLGLPPHRPGRALDLCGLAEVVDYPARDMTITVQAGITVARLQEILRGENQRLPVDVPGTEQATLGGSLAVNASGPRRYGHGTLRDYVIGISSVNDEGHEVKAGGRVVKNVAGYDLCKLHIGALGTLGIITQVTLKVRPRPEEQMLLAVGVNTEGLAAALDLLHASATRPVCLDILNAAAARHVARQTAVQLPLSEWVVVVGCEDNLAATTWQLRQLLDELPAEQHNTLDSWAGFPADAVWRGLTEITLVPDAIVSFKASVLPHATADFCRLAAEQTPELLLQAHAGNGIVIGHLLAKSELSQVAGWLARLRVAAVAAQGNLVITRCPTAWKKELPIWGEPRGDLWLMRRVREALDPRGLFNPGRFVS